MRAAHPAAGAGLTPNHNDDEQGNAMKGFAKRIWLLLYSEGGYWTGSEVDVRLRIGKNVYTALGEMVRSGFLSRKKGPNIDGEMVVQYGVTSACKLPRGVSVAEIEGMLLVASPRIVYVKADNAIRGRPKPQKVAVHRGKPLNEAGNSGALLAQSARGPEEG